MESKNSSPYTIESYARHLKLWWEFLRDCKSDWQHPSLEHLADFSFWLQEVDSRAVSMQEREAKRTEKTINTILAAVYSFYNYQEYLGNCILNAYRDKSIPRYVNSYKPLLYGFITSKSTRTKLVKLKEPKIYPKTLLQEQVQRVIDTCQLQRDKFLICLLYRTGMRIGQALGLRHGDIERRRDGKHKIHIIPRKNNVNRTRAKSRNTNVIDVSQELLHLYTEYLINEYPESQFSDYIFVNVAKGNLGQPMTISNAEALFNRLSKAVGFKVTPHLLRHTHASELIRAKRSMVFVQKRLGHTSIQTTVNTYIHLTDEDMWEEYQLYLLAQQRD